MLYSAHPTFWAQTGGHGSARRRHSCRCPHRLRCSGVQVGAEAYMSELVRGALSLQPRQLHCGGGLHVEVGAGPRLALGEGNREARGRRACARCPGPSGTLRLHGGVRTGRMLGPR